MGLYNHKVKLSHSSFSYLLLQYSFTEDFAVQYLQYKYREQAPLAELVSVINWKFEDSKQGRSSEFEWITDTVDKEGVERALRLLSRHGRTNFFKSVSHRPGELNTQFLHEQNTNVLRPRPFQVIFRKFLKF